jgi:hypothetical protein
MPGQIIQAPIDMLEKNSVPKGLKGKCIYQVGKDLELG